MLNNINKMTLALAVIVVLVGLTTIASAQYDDFNWGEEEAALFMGLGFTMCCIVVVVLWIIWLLIAIWVYKDAEKRRKSGIVWFLVVFILGIIGLIIWLLVRPPITDAPGAKRVDSDRKCPNCGRNIPMDARACPYCAKKFEE